MQRFLKSIRSTYNIKKKKLYNYSNAKRVMAKEHKAPTDPYIRCIGL